MSGDPKIDVGPALGAARRVTDDGEVSTSVEMGSWVGAELGSERDDLIDVVLGGTYRLLRVVGEGAMGRVYEAQHTRIAGKRFAVKILHPELVRHEDVRERFLREAEAAALVDHPNVVGVYDVGATADGCPYLVAELLAGEDLSGRLEREGTLPVARAVRIARQVAQALGAAHARGVIHRDVKPENVFLTGDPARPMVKVLDFGISHLDKSGKRLTKIGTVMGTPWYMPPEQGRGQRVDHRADIYGLGGILYRALTGVAPHDKGDPGATLLDVLTQDLVAPRVLAPALPAPLEAILLRAMARRAEDRFATMQELEEALAPYDTERGAAPAAAPGLGAGPAAGAQATDAEAVRPTIVDFAVSGSGAAEGTPPSPAAAIAERPRVTQSWLVRLALGLAILVLLVALVALVRGQLVRCP
ncbi:MAG: serine/threonine protein kinase [Myxococcales bacterium]|nr:serine/threonine protein kinase [Myxococcales bacterium]